MSILRTLLSRIPFPSAAQHLITALPKPMVDVCSLPLLLRNKVQPALQAQSSCGFKVKGNVKRRCRDCLLVWRQNRLYNICKTHGRHKQMGMVKDPKNTWILTHATQGKVRQW